MWSRVKVDCISFVNNFQYSSGTLITSFRTVFFLRSLIEQLGVYTWYPEPRNLTLILLTAIKSQIIYFIYYTICDVLNSKYW